MPELLERFSTPTSPGALLQAVHPGLGLGLPGARPTGTVDLVTQVPDGAEVELSVPATWSRAPSGGSAEGQVAIALDIDGVRRSAVFTRLDQPRSDAGHRPSQRMPDLLAGPFSRHRDGMRILVEPEANDEVSRCLRSRKAVGQRVFLGQQDPSASHPRISSASHPNTVDVRDPAGGHEVHSGDVRIDFADSGVAAGAAPNDLLLEVAEAAGLTPTTGCRRGVCHRCTTTLLSGTTTNTRDGTVSRPGDAVRICVSTATTDVELKL